MKILIMANSDIGLFKFRRELLEELVKHYRVYVSVPDGEFIPDIKKLGCRTSICRLMDRRGTNPLKDLRLLEYYCRLVKKIRPDMVFTYTVKPNVYGGLVCRKFRIPYVANVTGLGTAIENGGILQKIALFLYKYGLRNAQKVFFQNTENRDFFLREKVVSTPYDLLPGSGVNLVQHCMEPYPQDTKELVFTAIGRIMGDKGTNELLKAAENVRRKYPEVKFRLLGFFDDDYESVIKKAERAGTVEYISQQKDIHPFIAESHAIIHPSHHEGMSNVLLEAAATGRPVLASDIPGCRETFDEGKSGFGFRPKDAADLACTIEKFILLPYEKKVQMGLAGRKKMEKEFDRRNVVETYMKEVEKITEEKETCFHSCTKN